MSTLDIINAIENDEPLEASAKFKEIMDNKLSDVIDDKRQEITNLIFHPDDEDSE